MLDAKLTDGSPTKRIQMAPAAEFFAKVVRDRAHISALTRADYKGNFGQRILG